MLEDKMGSVAFSMYPKVYEKYGEFLASEEPIKVFGRVDLRDESEPKISIDRVELWKKEKSEKKESSSVIYVLLKDNSEKELVSGVLQMSPGNVPVIAQIKVNGEYKLLKFPFEVDANEELLHGLQMIVGEKNIKYVKK